MNYLSYYEYKIQMRLKLMSMISDFNVIPIHWPLTVDSEMTFLLFGVLAEVMLVFSYDLWGSRKIHCLTSEVQCKFHFINQYRTHRSVIHVISEIYEGINLLRQLIFLSN